MASILATPQPSFIALAAIALLACGSPEDLAGLRELPVVRGYATVRVDGPMIEVVPEDSAIDTVEFSGETLIILDPPVFTESDIASVSRSTTDPRVTDFWLNDDGSQALSAHTANPKVIQTRLAVRLMDRWVAFPSIQSQIRNGHFIVLDLNTAEQDTAEAAFGTP